MREACELNQKIECPPGCKLHRQVIDEKIKDMKDDTKELLNKIEAKLDNTVTLSSIKWGIGILVALMLAVCGGAFGILYGGQQANTREIVASNARMTLELSDWKTTISAELKRLSVELAKISTRLDLNAGRAEQEEKAAEKHK